MPCFLNSCSQDWKPSELKSCRCHYSQDFTPEKAIRDKELSSISEIKLCVPRGTAWAPSLAAQASWPGWQRAGNQLCANTGGISLWAFLLISRGSVGREEKEEKLRTELGSCSSYKPAASFTFFWKNRTKEAGECTLILEIIILNAIVRKKLFSRRSYTRNEGEGNSFCCPYTFPLAPKQISV